MNKTIIIPSHNEPSAVMLKIACHKMFPKTQVIIAHDNEGKGKGWAIRQVLNRVSSDVIILIDGDLDISPKEIIKLLPHIDDYDVVAAEKDVSDLPIQRAIISIGYRVLIKLLFGLSVWDTQTGLKIFRRYALKEFEADGFSYDVEVLYKAKKAGCRIISIPIKVNIDKKVRSIQIWNTLKETTKLWLALSFQSIMKM